MPRTYTFLGGADLETDSSTATTVNRGRSSSATLYKRSAQANFARGKSAMESFYFLLVLALASYVGAITEPVAEEVLFSRDLNPDFTPCR